MKTLNALIIDDEPLAHKVILKYAEEVPFLDIVAQAHRATDAYEPLREYDIDLIFLDINLPKLQGLDFLRTLPHRPLVIVTSAYEEYALEGYELQVCDYLLKPFRFERFLKAVHHAHRQIRGSSSAAELLTSPPPAEDHLFIRVDKRYQRVNVTEILYLESYGNYVKVWIGERFLLTPRTLSSFERELPADRFVRVHKSFHVRKAAIDYVEGNRVFLTNGQAVPIGKNYRPKVKEWLS